MFMNHDQAELLVTQVQHAHRLLAGFYQRILPAIDNLAGHYNATFWYWEPSEFSRPCGASIRPSSKWAWDFLPLVATRLVYVRKPPSLRVMLLSLGATGSLNVLGAETSR